VETLEVISSAQLAHASLRKAWLLVDKKLMYSRLMTHVINANESPCSLKLATSPTGHLSSAHARHRYLPLIFDVGG
jgi:hypothetical protein